MGSPFRARTSLLISLAKAGWKPTTSQLKAERLILAAFECWGRETAACSITLVVISLANDALNLSNTERIAV